MNDTDYTLDNIDENELDKEHEVKDVLSDADRDRRKVEDKIEELRLRKAMLEYDFDFDD